MSDDEHVWTADDETRTEVGDCAERVLHGLTTLPVISWEALEAEGARIAALARERLDEQP